MLTAEEWLSTLLFVAVVVVVVVVVVLLVVHSFLPYSIGISVVYYCTVAMGGTSTGAGTGTNACTGTGTGTGTGTCKSMQEAVSGRFEGKIRGGCCSVR